MRPAIWTTVAAAAASISLALGMRQTFGLFLLPLSAEAGISPAVLGTAVAIHNLVWGLSQPVTGSLADRYGAGRVMAIGRAAAGRRARPAGALDLGRRRSSSASAS